VLAKEGENTIDFEAFVHALSIFNDKDNIDRKIEFLFKVYDIDGDGYVTKEELLVILQTLVGNSLSDSQLEQISEKTVSDMNSEVTGKLSFEDFKAIFDNGVIA
jgi:serine/threonine-protein phosphatase 2B regulatory subunit